MQSFIVLACLVSELAGDPPLVLNVTKTLLLLGLRNNVSPESLHVFF